MRPIPSLLVVVIFVSSIFSQTRDYTRWVNPFIGTGGHGHTFPGATMPFGMVQLSPDTRIDNWDGSSGYHYSDDIIYGFSHTHLSGTGIPDGADILLRPSNEWPIRTKSTKFSHTNEVAEPGFYSVKLGDGILAELTSTTRVGFHRYTFPKQEFASVTLDLSWRDRLLGSDISFVNPKTITGFRRSSSWAKNQIVYFAIEFSIPYQMNAVTIRNHPDEKIGTNVGFKLAPNERLLVKVAISYVSIEGARKNLEAELPGWDFDKVRADAKAAWNKELSKIDVSGGTDEQTTNFYSALYHSMIHPNVFNDVDGRYKGHDGKIHSIRNADAPVRNEREARKTSTPQAASADEGVRGPSGRKTGTPPSASADEGVRGPSGRKTSTPQAASADEGVRGPSGRKTSTPRAASADEGVRGPSGRKTSTPQAASADEGVSGPSGRKTSTPQAASADEGVRGPSEQYTVFSLWDTFRAAHPLYTIIDQKRTVDYINTFLRIYEQGGRLPVWELWGEETDTMIGYHSVSVIADAMSKGIKGFDYEKAYAAAKHSAMMDHHGLAAYKKRGFVSGEDDNESVSKTLEYAYNDWCIMKMGSLLFNTRSFATGKNPRNDQYLKQLSEEIDYYRRRAGNFENLFDPETRFFRPKRNGGFIKPFAPQEVTFHFTEGNSWQYSFFAPHDVSRLMQLMGGDEKFVAKLDELFTTDAKLSGREQPDITGLMGQYAHGNEPSHHIAYLYNYAGAPWKTQHRVRKILDEFYKNAPDGLIGNEDCGQMSAWYVLSASGFYPVAPGDERYDIGTPIFKQVVFNLENGKKFIVRAPNVSASNFYVRSVKWKGQALANPYITQYHITEGGVLEFEMASTPNEKAFEYSSSSSVYQESLPVPSVDGDRVFKDKTTISMKSVIPRAEIRYTLDGSDPTSTSALYSAPIAIDKTTNIKAASFIEGLKPSLVVDATFSKRANDWTVKLISEFNSQYPGSSYDAIIDGLRGNHNFAAGEWQGFWGKPFEAIIDLQRETEIREVGGSFLQSARSWIWMPDRLEFEVSNDGANFAKVADWKPGFPQTEMNGTPKEFVQKITPVKARYVRVRASNIGKIPGWHIGAGGDPWIFVDEVFIR